jgi:hypothetical protein
MSLFRDRRWRRPSFLLSIFSLVALFSLFIQPAQAAWQEIADYTDCGSTNFKTQKILVDFNSDTYWLNVSIVGEFAREVIDSSPQTNKESTVRDPFHMLIV